MVLDPCPDCGGENLNMLSVREYRCRDCGRKFPATPAEPEVPDGMVCAVCGASPLVFAGVFHFPPGGGFIWDCSAKCRAEGAFRA
jgi:DNA-directed RNA polymerase subunit RPC12/RpoP